MSCCRVSTFCPSLFLNFFLRSINNAYRFHFSAFCQQKEIDLLNDEIAAMKMTVAERTERLGKEADIHTQIKKDIEV